MDQTVWKNLKVMFGLDLGFVLTLVVQQLTDANLLKQITGLTTYVLLLLAILNSFNVLLSIFQKWKSKKNDGKD